MRTRRSAAAASVEESNVDEKVSSIENLKPVGEADSEENPESNADGWTTKNEDDGVIPSPEVGGSNERLESNGNGSPATNGCEEKLELNEDGTPMNVHMVLSHDEKEKLVLNADGGTAKNEHDEVIPSPEIDGSEERLESSEDGTPKNVDVVLSHDADSEEKLVSNADGGTAKNEHDEVIPSPEIDGSVERLESRLCGETTMTKAVILSHDADSEEKLKSNAAGSTAMSVDVVPNQASAESDNTLLSNNEDISLSISEEDIIDCSTSDIDFDPNSPIQSDVDPIEKGSSMEPKEVISDSKVLFRKDLNEKVKEFEIIGRKFCEEKKIRFPRMRCFRQIIYFLYRSDKLDVQNVELELTAPPYRKPVAKGINEDVKESNTKDSELLKIDTLPTNNEDVKESNTKVSELFIIDTQPTNSNLDLQFTTDSSILSDTAPIDSVVVELKSTVDSSKKSTEDVAGGKHDGTKGSVPFCLSSSPVDVEKQSAKSIESGNLKRMPVTSKWKNIGQEYCIRKAMTFPTRKRFVTILEQLYGKEKLDEDSLKVALDKDALAAKRGEVPFVKLGEYGIPWYRSYKEDQFNKFETIAKTFCEDKKIILPHHSDLRRIMDDLFMTGKLEETNLQLRLTKHARENSSTAQKVHYKKVKDRIGWSTKAEKNVLPPNVPSFTVTHFKGMTKEEKKLARAKFFLLRTELVPIVIEHCHKIRAPFPKQKEYNRLCADLNKVGMLDEENLKIAVEMSFDDECNDGPPLNNEQIDLIIKHYRVDNKIDRKLTRAQVLQMIPKELLTLKHHWNLLYREKRTNLFWDEAFNPDASKYFHLRPNTSLTTSARAENTESKHSKYGVPRTGQGTSQVRAEYVSGRQREQVNAMGLPWSNAHIQARNLVPKRHNVPNGGGKRRLDGDQEIEQLLASLAEKSQMLEELGRQNLESGPAQLTSQQHGQNIKMDSFQHARQFAPSGSSFGDQGVGLGKRFHNNRGLDPKDGRRNENDRSLPPRVNYNPPEDLRRKVEELKSGSGQTGSSIPPPLIIPTRFEEISRNRRNVSQCSSNDSDRRYGGNNLIPPLLPIPPSLPQTVSSRPAESGMLQQNDWRNAKTEPPKKKSRFDEDAQAKSRQSQSQHSVVQHSSFNFDSWMSCKAGPSQHQPPSLPPVSTPRFDEDAQFKSRQSQSQHPVVQHSSFNFDSWMSCKAGTSQHQPQSMPPVVTPRYDGSSYQKNHYKPSPPREVEDWRFAREEGPPPKKSRSEEVRHPQPKQSRDLSRLMEEFDSWMNKNATSSEGTSRTGRRDRFSPPKTSGMSKASTTPPSIEPGTTCKIAIVHVTYPGARITTEQASSIRDALLDRIGVQNGVGPRFIDTYEERGAVVFECEDQLTVTWLWVNSSTITPWRGANLMPISWENPIELTLEVPKMMEKLSPENICERLMTQNPKLSTKLWTFKHSELSTRGFDLIFHIDDESKESLKSLGLKVYLGFSRVNVHIKEQ